VIYFMPQPNQDTVVGGLVGEENTAANVAQRAKWI
jgi:hypothetical protein